MAEHKKPSDQVRSLHPLEQQNKKIEELGRLASDYLEVRAPAELLTLNQSLQRTDQSIFINAAVDLLYKAGFDTPEEIEEEHLKILADKMNQNILINQDLIRQIKQRLAQVISQNRRRGGPSL